MTKSEINNCSIQLLDPDPVVLNGCREHFFVFRKPNIVFMLFVVQMILYGVIRIEETKLVCVISRKCMFG